MSPTKARGAKERPSTIYVIRGSERGRVVDPPKRVRLLGWAEAVHPHVPPDKQLWLDKYLRNTLQKERRDAEYARKVEREWRSGIRVLSPRRGKVPVDWDHPEGRPQMVEAIIALIEAEAHGATAPELCLHFGRVGSYTGELSALAFAKWAVPLVDKR